MGVSHGCGYVCLAYRNQINCLGCLHEPANTILQLPLFHVQPPTSPACSKVEAFQKAWPKSQFVHGHADADESRYIRTGANRRSFPKQALTWSWTPAGQGVCCVPIALPRTQTWSSVRESDSSSQSTGGVGDGSRYGRPLEALGGLPAKVGGQVLRPAKGVLSSTSTLSINLAPARRLPPTNHNLRPSALSTFQDFFHLLSCGMFLRRRSPRLIQPGETGALERSLTCITTMRTGLVAACSTPKCFRETVLAVLSLHWYHTIGQIDLIFSGWSSPLLSHPEVDLGNGSYPSA